MVEVHETYFQESHEWFRNLTMPTRCSGGQAMGSGRKAAYGVPVLVGRVRGQPYSVDKLLAKLNGGR